MSLMARLGSSSVARAAVCSGRHRPDHQPGPAAEHDRGHVPADARRVAPVSEQDRSGSARRRRRSSRRPVATSASARGIAPGPEPGQRPSRRAEAGAASACSSQLRSALAGAAPACRAMTCPPRMTISVGMAWTAKRCCSRGDSSTLILTSFIRPGQLRGQLFQRRADHPARPAPGRPEVDQHGQRRLLDDLGEGAIVGIGHPGQRLVAVAAVRDPAGRGGHAIPAPAVRALDDLSCHSSARRPSCRIPVADRQRPGPSPVPLAVLWPGRLGRSLSACTFGRPGRFRGGTSLQ